MEQNITSILTTITAIISFICAIITLINSIQKNRNSNDRFAHKRIHGNNKQNIKSTDSIFSNQAVQGYNVTANQYTYDNSKTINYNDNRKNYVFYRNNSNDNKPNDPVTFFMFLLIVVAIIIFISKIIYEYLWMMAIVVLLTTLILVIKTLTSNMHKYYDKLDIIKNFIIIVSPAAILLFYYLVSSINEVSSIAPEIVKLNNITEILEYMGTHSNNIYEIALFCVNNICIVSSTILLSITQLAIAFKNIIKGKMGDFINYINKLWFVYIIFSLIPFIICLIFTIQKAVNSNI